MKALLGITFLCGALQAAIIGEFPLSPGANFGYQSPLDNCPANNSWPQCMDANFFAPSILNLASLGIVAGERITLTSGGWLCVYADRACDSPQAPDIGGILSTSAVLLDPQIQDRVPGAVDPGVPTIGHNPSLDTYYDHHPTDEFGAFYIARVTLTVPPNAHYLFLGILDSFRSDNEGAPWVRIDTVLTEHMPEPATWAMIALGILALAVKECRSRDRASCSV